MLDPMPCLQAEGVLATPGGYGYGTAVATPGERAADAIELLSESLIADSAAPSPLAPSIAADSNNATESVADSVDFGGSASSAMAAESNTSGGRRSDSVGSDNCGSVTKGRERHRRSHGSVGNGSGGESAEQLARLATLSLSQLGA